MHSDVVNKFSTHLKEVLTKALCFAVQEKQSLVLPEYLLWAMADQKGSMGAELLRKQSIEAGTLRPLLDSSSENQPGSIDKTPTLSEETKRAIERAVYTAHNHRHRYVGTEHLLAGLLHLKNPLLETFFKDQKIDLSSLQDQLTLVFKSTSRFPEMEELLEDTSSSSKKMFSSFAPLTQEETNEDEDDDDEESSLEKGTPALDFFTRDLTAEEHAQTIDPVIGRAEEIERVMEILCRRTKNNPILAGEPGVGKTAIVEGLAKKIYEGDVPPVLAHKRILALDLASVIAGTVYRGEFEGRIKQIVEETKNNPDIILFIDELHTIMGTGAASGSLDTANMLKPALARGDVRCIGATTPAEFKKHIEPDSALERRFQRVNIDEPSAEESLAILKGLAPYYERYHHVDIKPEALETAVTLSERYLSDRFFPDKAIDLIDEAAASLRVKHLGENTSEQLLRQQEILLEDIRKEKREAILEERFEDALQLKERERSLKTEMTNAKASPQGSIIGTVTAAHIMNVVSRSTGIPAGNLATEEKKRLRHLHKHLADVIVGQPHVTTSVASTLLRSSVGITPPERPQASFLFVGPSGVGKTALARELAKELFQDTSALIHLDMSEYSEGYTISKLVGSPAGYVGYREGAKLTDQVKQKPYAVVLFDEIEKAHRDVQALLLQILETGSLSDATGKSISFRQAVIVMTSNVGLERFEGSALGFHEAHLGKEARSSSVHKDLKERFRPELLNRIDQILFFHPLDKTSLATIAKKHLEDIVERLADQSVTLRIDKAVYDLIAETAYSETIGARAIRRYIQDHVESTIAKKLLAATMPKQLLLKPRGTSLIVTREK